jgi:hypothetical protein
MLMEAMVFLKGNIFNMLIAKVYLGLHGEVKADGEFIVP